MSTEAPQVWKSDGSSIGWRVQELERRIATLEGEVQTGRDTLTELMVTMRQVRADLSSIKRIFYTIGGGVMLALFAAVTDLVVRVS